MLKKKKKALLLKKKKLKYFYTSGAQCFASSFNCPNFRDEYCKFFSLLVGPYLLPLQIAPTRKQRAVHIVKRHDDNVLRIKRNITPTNVLYFLLLQKKMYALFLG